MVDPGRIGACFEITIRRAARHVKFFFNSMLFNNVRNVTETHEIIKGLLKAEAAETISACRLFLTRAARFCIAFTDHLGDYAGKWAHRPPIFPILQEER